MNIETPPKWRKGQTIFNFLWWLQSDNGYEPEVLATPVRGRMADPFHIPDSKLDELFDEFLKIHGV